MPSVAPNPTTRVAERHLRRAGHDPGTVDGQVTAKTRRAVRDFQKGVGLPATGELNRDTFERLDTLDKKMRARPGVFQPGMRRPGIEEAEKRLRRLGYDPGAADGLYTERTARAVEQFKKDQGSDNRSGELGEGARKELRQEAKALNHKPRHRRVKKTNENKRENRLAGRAARRDGGVGIGADHRAVTVFKKHLRCAGYDTRSTGPVFDERTEGMVKEFQRQSDLPVTGRVNLRTWKQLRKAKLESTGPTSPRQRVGERSGAVKRTEQLLEKNGFAPGPVDGLYTSRTQRALDRFRKTFGLGQRGEGVDDKTLKQLKLGAKGQLLPRGQKVTGYVLGTPRTIRVVDVDGKKMERSTAKAWKKMKAAAARDGVHLQLNSGWRSMDEQTRLYNGYVQGLPGFNLAARPGYSNHQSGAALDINVGLGGSNAVGVGTTYSWLANNAPRFGFQRIAPEAWHWEFQPLLRKYA